MKKSAKYYAILSFTILLGLIAYPALADVSIDETTTTPSTVKWTESITLKLNISINGGWIWWNGTVYCNITDPTGIKYTVDSDSVALSSSTTKAWYNYSVVPSNHGTSGTWNVTWDFVKTSGNGTLLDKYASFTLEQYSGYWSRTLNSFSALVFLAIIIAVWVFVIIVFLDKLGKGETPK